MNAVDTLTRAIKKLEGLQDDRGYVEFNGWLAESNPGDTARSWLEPPADLSPITNDELIVTLHRTIGAQIDWLRDQLVRVIAEQNVSGVPIHYRHALALAASILNEEVTP